MQAYIVQGESNVGVDSQKSGSSPSRMNNQKWLLVVAPSKIPSLDLIPIEMNPLEMAVWYNFVRMKYKHLKSLNFKYVLFGSYQALKLPGP